MNKVVIGIIVIIILVGGAYVLLSQNASPAPTNQNTQPSATQTGDTQQAPTNNSGTSASGGVSVSVGNTPPMTATVSYNGSSFSPSSITVAKGGTVTFSDTAGSMWLASDPHPTHTGYDGTSRNTHCATGYSGPKPFDQCSTGSSYTFTFTKTGSFGYHDHMNSGAHGTVVVQ